MKLNKYLKIVLSLSLSMVMIIQPVTGINAVNAGELISENDSEVHIVEELVENDEVAGIEILDDELSDDIDEIDAESYSMPETYVLTSEQIEEKNNLANHIEEYDALVPGIDYVENEFVVLADSIEEGKTIATAYHSEIKEYDTGVVTLKVKEGKMEEVLYAACSLDNNLPAIWPNFIRYTCDSEDPSIIEYNDPYIQATATDYQWQHSVVGSFSAWNEGYTGKDIKVAVLDSGIFNGHEDLPKVIALGCHDEDLTGKNSSHGSHVGGIIGARGNNGLGGSGIAPEAILYSGCVTPDGNGSDADIMAGIKKAIEQDVDIINMSLGGIGYSGAFETVIDNAYNSGIAVFAAAGNDGGRNLFYPAGYNHSIAIAATNADNSRASFSNYGSHVKLCAPGVNIYSTSNGNPDNYEYMSGTSQATPVVSGVAAVVLGADQTLKEMKKDGKKVDALLDVLQKSATKVKTPEMGAGIPNLLKALDISNASEAPNAPVIKSSNTEKGIDVILTAEKGCDIYFRLDGKTPTVKNGVVDSDGLTYLYDGMFEISPEDNVKSIKAITVNKAGISSAVSSYQLNYVVKVSSITIEGVTNISKGKYSQLKAYVYPSNAKNKAVTWNLYDKNGNGPINTTEQKSLGVTVSATGRITAANNATAGETYIVEAASKDGNCTKSVSINIIDSVRITSVNYKDKTVEILTDEEVTPELIASSIDGGELASTDFVYSSSNSTVAYADETGKIYGVNAGKAVITATANDSSGKKATINVVVKRAVNNIYINGYDTVVAGKSIQLNADIAPFNATNKSLIWTIDNAEGLKVAPNGKVSTTAKTPTGKYTVTATAKDGSKVFGTFAVSVSANGITKLGLQDKKDASVTVFRVKGTTNASVSKKVYLDIEGANRDCIDVQSSNSGIVNAYFSLEDSTPCVLIKSTGKATGKSVVTVRSTDGTNKLIKINVNVVNPASRLTISLPNGKDAYVVKGRSLQLSATFGTQYGKIEKQNVVWSVLDDTGVISVSKSGLVKIDNKAKAFEGKKYTIVAKTTDGTGLEGKITVKAVNPTTYIYGLYNSGRPILPGTTLNLDVNDNTYEIPIASDSYYLDYTCSSSNPDVASGTFGYNDSDDYCLKFIISKRGKTTFTISSADGCKSIKYTIIAK